MKNCKIKCRKSSKKKQEIAIEEEKMQKEICKITKCFNNHYNSDEKWQMDLCILHLIEFIKWFNKDNKINAIFDQFYLKWETVKSTNQYKEKRKIWRKIQELELYFEKQRKLGIEFEKNNNFQ